MTTTKTTTKTLTNAAWAGPDFPARTLTLVRTRGTGPIRQGDRFEVREGGVLRGTLEFISTRVWLIFDAEGVLRTALGGFLGTQAEAAWAAAHVEG